MTTINTFLNDAVAQLKNWQATLQQTDPTNSATSAFSQALEAAKNAAQSAQQSVSNNVQPTELANSPQMSASLSPAISTGKAHLLPSGSEEDKAHKPNTREFMDATGTDFETAVDVLYGTIGSNQDLRDWKAIMASSDPLADARASTGAMYNGSGSTSALSYKPDSSLVLAKSGNLAVLNTTPTEPGSKATDMLAIVDGKGNQLTSAGNAEVLSKRAINFGFDVSKDMNAMSSSVSRSNSASMSAAGSTMSQQMDFVLNTLLDQIKRN